jgi:hypothetical protein
MIMITLTMILIPGRAGVEQYLGTKLIVYYDTWKVIATGT